MAKSTALTPLKEFTKKTCQETKESKQCQDVYKKIQDNGGDTLTHALVCEDRSYIGAFPRALMTTVDYTAGCAIGGWQHLEKMGTMIGESAAKFVLDREKKEEELVACNKDPKKKKALYDEYNVSVPTVLRISTPTDAELASQKCEKIESDLVIKQRQQSQRAFNKVRGRLNDLSATYTPEEQEFIDWTNKVNRPSTNGNVIELAKKRLKEMGVELDCYNDTYQAALVCEAIADVMTVAGGPLAAAIKGLRAARIAKLASIEKVEDYVNAVNSAKRATEGAGGRITDAADKARVLYKRSNLDTEEAISAFEKIKGRKLTQKEANQVFEMHEVGTAEGRGYLNYTKADIDKKRALAEEINPDTGKAFFSAEDQRILLRNGITGGAGNVQKATARETYAAKAAKEDYSQYHRLHAEAAAGEGKIEEAVEAYKKAYKAYAKEKNVDLKDAASTKQSLSKLSERDLAQLEDFAASSNNAAVLEEAAIQKWSKIAQETRKKFSGRDKGPEYFWDAYNAELAQLGKLTNSSDKIISDAAKAKINALQKGKQMGEANPKMGIRY